MIKNPKFTQSTIARASALAAIGDPLNATPALGGYQIPPDLGRAEVWHVSKAPTGQTLILQEVDGVPVGVGIAVWPFTPLSDDTAAALGRRWHDYFRSRGGGR